MKLLGWIFFAVAAIIIFILTMKRRNKNEITCEIKDPSGRTLIITGRADDPQFMEMCRLKTNERIYVNNYPYTFIRWWRFPIMPSPPAPPAPPGGGPPGGGPPGGGPPGGGPPGGGPPGGGPPGGGPPGRGR